LIDLPALGFDLVIPQAVDWPGYNFPISGADGEPYDLTGCTARGEIRPFAGSRELYYAWSTSPTTGEGLITLSGNILNIRTLATETSTWRWSTASYDIVLTNPAAPIGLRTSRIVMGTVERSPAVTVLAAA
jgi:hypothetical protein